MLIAMLSLWHVTVIIAAAWANSCRKPKAIPKATRFLAVVSACHSRAMTAGACSCVMVFACFFAVCFRRTKKWESHIWDNKKQVYLGGFDNEQHAAKAHDIMALKCRGVGTIINFKMPIYDTLIPLLDMVTRVSGLRSPFSDVVCIYSGNTKRFDFLLLAVLLRCIVWMCCMDIVLAARLQQQIVGVGHMLGDAVMDARCMHSPGW